MPLIKKENILTAQRMYLDRIKVLQGDMDKALRQGLELGATHEEQVIATLDEIEQEVDNIQDCVHILNYLLRG